jgi:hypothetical protein
MAAVTYDIADHVTNTTFVGVQFTVTVNSVAVDLTGAEIKMNVKPRDFKNSVNYEFGVGTGLTLTTPASGIFTLDEQVITIPAGNWKYDVTFYLSDGSIHNYIKGEWTILENL